MKIKYVTYGELISGVGYNNKRIEITVELNEDDKPDDVLQYARIYVQTKLGKEPELPF